LSGFNFGVRIFCTLFVAASDESQLERSGAVTAVTEPNQRAARKPLRVVFFAKTEERIDCLLSIIDRVCS
jgi:hypothetical protein